MGEWDFLQRKIHKFETNQDMPTSKITINPGSLDPYGHLSWLVESLSRDSVLGRNWTILMPAHKILKNCPPFFIFKNSERVLRIDIGRWKFQKFIITYLSLPRKNLKTQLQLLLPLNFAYAKKLLVNRHVHLGQVEITSWPRNPRPRQFFPRFSR